MRIAITFAALQFLALPVSAQWVIQPSGTTARLRGVSASDGQVVWASGTGGTVLRAAAMTRPKTGWAVGEHGRIARFDGRSQIDRSP